MDRIKIKEPCQENWSGMIPTPTGAFCQQCARQVIDFTSKSDVEIKAAFREMPVKPICTRIKASQLETLNRESEAWQLNSPHRIQGAMIFSLVVVFGLSLFSCSSKNEEKTIVKIQKMMTQAWTTPAASIESPVEKTVLPLVPKEKSRVESRIGCAEPLAAPKKDYIIMGKPLRFSPKVPDTGSQEPGHAAGHDENRNVAE